MNINDLLGLMINRVAALTEARKSAAVMGDIARVVEIDNDLATTHITIEQMRRVIESNN